MQRTLLALCLTIAFTNSAVNAVVENYIQKNFEARWGAAQKASGWLSQQLLDLKAKLEKS